MNPRATHRSSPYSCLTSGHVSAVSNSKSAARSKGRLRSLKFRLLFSGSKEISTT